MSIDDEKLERLIHFLTNNNAREIFFCSITNIVIKLSLENNKIGDVGVQYLAHALENNTIR